MQEGDGHHEREGWGGRCDRCDSLSIKMKLYSLRTTADYINLYTQHLNSLLDSVFTVFSLQPTLQKRLDALIKHLPK